ncbi:hypothetical protein SPD48_07130 [Pseudogracilibacillus sp. SE30717A]|uniref:hypothetical protein n=1 Tax=Pseudogracilibacillus sp. SE30717A TaxID=3098293 RepID=UPI00300DD0D1
MFSLFSLIPLLIYIAIFVFIIWFAISLINAQRERNDILKEISSKLNGLNFGEKED